ncbi:hypothetical protein [Flavobacterium alkalisoli]|uniref:hypothetical protein n=1 Tax=Flavobacterium alkalisoli TaxID=2602769 RepID=UPI003A8CEAC7
MGTGRLVPLIYEVTMNEMKVCTECKVNKHVEQFTIDDPETGRRKSKCGLCRSLNSNMKAKEKRKEERPFDFYQCTNEDCNNIWSIKHGSYCSHCGSKGEF